MSPVRFTYSRRNFSFFILGCLFFFFRRWIKFSLVRHNFFEIIVLWLFLTCRTIRVLCSHFYDGSRFSEFRTTSESCMIMKINALSEVCAVILLCLFFVVHNFSWQESTISRQILSTRRLAARFEVGSARLRVECVYIRPPHFSANWWDSVADFWLRDVFVWRRPVWQPPFYSVFDQDRCFISSQSRVYVIGRTLIVRKIEWKITIFHVNVFEGEIKTWFQNTVDLYTYHGGPWWKNVMVRTFSSKIY